VNLLFVTWDGPQVSYLEGLFLPLFQRLQARGICFHVIQFTWGSKENIERSRYFCEAAEVGYRTVPVIRRPVVVGALLTATMGIHYVRKAVRDWNIDAVMPRSTMPALVCMLAHSGGAIPLVFDADGLPNDERVDFSGLSPIGPVYRVLRDIEAQMVRRADIVLTRSRKAVEILIARAGAGTHREKFHVVGNGRDADFFIPMSAERRIEQRRQLGLDPNSPLIVYAGSLGPQYCLLEMLRFLRAVRTRSPETRLLILTQSVEYANGMLLEFPDLVDAISVYPITFDAVPHYLACADLGLALRRPSFSMQAVAPIKLGEYLLCGLPLVATRDVGDTSGISTDVGFLMDRMDDAAILMAAEWFTDCVLKNREAFTTNCREAGLKHFSMDFSEQSYLDAFSSLEIARAGAFTEGVR